MIKASCALYRSSLALSFVLLTSLFTACGGGGGSSPGGGGITPPPISTTVTAGSRIQFLYGLAGNRAVFDVKVVDGQARPVPNAAVTFSASLSGVELYPTQATTTSFGIVQTVIHLPPAANASFTVTATAATGGSFTATVNTGMRLVRTIGAPNAAGGVVRSDGSFISGGTTSDVGAIFNPDGTLRKVIAPSFAPGSIPTPGMFPWLAQDGMPYYWDFSRGIIYPMDSSFNLLSPIDLYGRGGVSGQPAPMMNASHKIFTTTCDGFLVHDATGAIIGDKRKLYWDYLGQSFMASRGCRLVLSPRGNPVIYDRTATEVTHVAYTLLAEYDQDGNVIQHLQLQDSPKFFSMADGTYIADDGHNISVLDSSFQLKQNLFPNTFGGLAGIDANGRFYFQTIGNEVQWDANDYDGSYTVVDSSGHALFSNGDSDQKTAAYPQYNQNHGTGLIAADDVSDTIYALQAVSASASNLVIYQHGEYVAAYPTTLMSYKRFALSPSNQIYATYFGSPIAVHDLTGQLVKTLSYPQLPSNVYIQDIQIDGNGYKYLDVAEQTIHVLGPDDTYVKAISIPQAGFPATGFALTPDGNFITVFNKDTNWVVQKSDTNGAVIWTASFDATLIADPSAPGASSYTYSPVRVDAAGRIYYGSLVLDSAGKKLSEAGFFRNQIVIKGRHVLMGGRRTIYELSAD